MSLTSMYQKNTQHIKQSLQRKLRHGFMFMALLLITITAYPMSGTSPFKAIRISYLDQKYDLIIIDPPFNGLNLYWRNAYGAPYLTFKNLITQLKTQNKKVHFAMNAGIFAPGYIPLGLHVENYERKIKLNDKAGEGNFYLKPNGVFYISRNGRARIKRSINFNQRTKQLRLATQSGPLLVVNNRLHHLLKKTSSHKFIRNGVGINQQGQIIFAITHSPVNLHTFAWLFKNHLQCKNALYLDGAISSAYIPALNRHHSGGLYAGILAITSTIQQPTDN